MLACAGNTAVYKWDCVPSCVASGDVWIFN
jgi:hypothetical protein